MRTTHIEITISQDKTETFDKDKFVFVCGTKRIRRRTVRFKD